MRLWMLGRAHPRSRGENCGPRACWVRVRGSSPLTRGKLVGRVSLFERRRLIPAHAGKTRRRSVRCGRFRAHPRSRGENERHVVAQLVHNGSSPLTRGKLVVHRRARFRLRLIPAHAGKTVGRTNIHRASRAHPRSRGENGLFLFPGFVFCFVLLGSSPLTRGKHRGEWTPGYGVRLIPAHAGKTQPTRHPH